MSRPANKSHMQQMKEDMLKERGGDPKKYGPGYQNPYQWQPKKAQGKVDKKAFDSNFKNQT
jgi:hypothetical protein